MTMKMFSKERFWFKFIQLLMLYSGQEKIVELLIQMGANIEAEDKFKFTPLNIAILKGNSKYLQLN